MAVLGSTTLTGCSSIPSFLPAGSLCLFQQTAAPVNWTKQTTHNDKALRVVSGTASSGGTNDFSKAFSSSFASGSIGDYTLLTADIPSHTHPGGSTFRNVLGGPGGGGLQGPTGLIGGSGAHNHGFTGTSRNFAVLYVDIILASKN
jgi:hypothetical protein